MNDLCFLEKVKFKILFMASKSIAKSYSIQEDECSLKQVIIDIDKTGEVIGTSLKWR